MPPEERASWDYIRVLYERYADDLVRAAARPCCSTTDRPRPALATRYSQQLIFGASHWRKQVRVRAEARVFIASLRAAGHSALLHDLDPPLAVVIHNLLLPAQLRDPANVHDSRR